MGPEPWPHSRNPSNGLHHLYREGTIVLENLLKSIFIIKKKNEQNSLFVVALPKQVSRHACELPGG